MDIYKSMLIVLDVVRFLVKVFYCGFHLFSIHPSVLIPKLLIDHTEKMKTHL